MTGAAPAGTRTLIFDVLGTVVDEGGSIAAEITVAAAAAGACRPRTSRARSRLSAAAGRASGRMG
jgi:hypothetical protein